MMMMIKKTNKKLTFRNNAPFRSCISKINNTFIDNAENLDIVMPMYNFLEYSTNYSMTSGSLWNYYRGEINDDVNENVSNRINNKTITSKSFEYMTKLIGSTPDDSNILEAEIVVPLKYWINFWRSLDLSLINCETELHFSWSKECISKTSIIPAVSGNPDANQSVPDLPAIQTTSATFQLNNAKFNVPVVTLSINDNIKFLANIKQGFKRLIS